MSNALVRGLRSLIAAFRPRTEAASPVAPAAAKPDDDIVAEHGLSYGAAPDAISSETQVEVTRQRNFGRTLP